MENDERRARDEAKEAVRKIRAEAELLRSAIAETRKRMDESHQLLARADEALIHQARELRCSSR
jgi:hypothetical protein